MSKRVILKSSYSGPAGRPSVVYSDVTVDEDAINAAKSTAGMARTGIMLMCRNERTRLLQKSGVAADQLTFTEVWAVEREESTPLAW